ncbi:hypothetical protein EC991_001735 [Linnemannia zychae]|nr:hypothetical protein EC991_001735 [Linnemannia zychae]
MKPMVDFFTIPELVALVASSLERQDLSRFMRTSRFIHSQCLRWFYRDVDVRVTSPLVHSEDGMRALEKNAHLTRGICMDTRFFEYYFECLALSAASEQQFPVGGESEEEAETEAVEGTGAGRAEDAEGMFTKMTNLSRFHCSLSSPGDKWDFWKRLRYEIYGSVLPNFCLMMPSTQSQHLESLTLNGMSILHPDELGKLARTIAGMTRLRTLRLGIEYQDELADYLIPHIFFKLPLTIQKFMVRLDNAGCLAIWREDTALISTLKNTNQRDGPLLELTEWDVIFNHLLDSPEPLFSMFSYCPELELVVLPQLLEVEDEERLATFIVKQCPKLCRLSRKDLGFVARDDESGADYVFGNHELIMLKITSEGMAENTLKSFYYDGFYEDQTTQRSRMPKLLDMQFGSLTEIHLWNTRSLSPYSVSQLLHLTPVLESLVLETCTDDYEVHYGPKLHSLSTVSWATNRLRELRLAVNLGYVADAMVYPGRRPFSLPRVHIDAEAMSFGGFLENVGKQKDLRVLDLRIVLPNRVLHPNERRWSYHDETFPGLLTLDGGTVSGGIHASFRRRRGFLNMLAGLSKLEELRGSVNLNPRDRYGYVTGREEAEWMREHWPRLKVAEFYPLLVGYHTPQVADAFVWLKSQLPGLIYSDDRSAW